MLGREIFEDRRRLVEVEAVLLQRRHAPVRVHGKVIARARLTDAWIDLHLVQGNAKLGREQSHFTRMRRRLKFVKGDGHGISSDAQFNSRICVEDRDSMGRHQWTCASPLECRNRTLVLPRAKAQSRLQTVESLLST